MVGYVEWRRRLKGRTFELYDFGSGTCRGSACRVCGTTTTAAVTWWQLKAVRGGGCVRTTATTLVVGKQGTNFDLEWSGFCCSFFFLLLI